MSAASVRIRLMQMEDIEQVAAIDTLSFSLPWPVNAYRFELQENRTSRTWVSELLQENQPIRIVAMIVSWLIVDEAHIATIAVHPGYRRLGIGKHLLAYALQDAKRQGMLTATLEVRAGNRAAQDLYTQFGFVVAGIRNRYYRDNQEDALIMSLDLAKLAGWMESVENTLILPEEVRHEG